MKKWSSEDGEEFSNSAVCFGREYNPGTGQIDVAKISIRGTYPATGWGWLEDTHEMAVVVNGKGYTETKSGDRYELKAGDVVYIEPGERFRWGGNFDMIVPCSPTFDPDKHHLED